MAVDFGYIVCVGDRYIFASNSNPFGANLFLGRRGGGGHRGAKNMTLTLTQPRIPPYTPADREVPIRG